MESVYRNQPVCFLTYLFPFCCAYYTRYRALDGDLSKYSCCQGYLDDKCFKAGMCKEKSCPAFCLGVESLFCLGPSMSTTRLFIMDKYDLRPDPFDNQIVRFNNCLAIASSVLLIFSLCFRDMRGFARSFQDFSRDCVFYSTVGCMVAQVFTEMRYRSIHSVEVSSVIAIDDDGSTEASPVVAEAVVVVKTEKLH